jgi:peptidoglycan/xylan/chitin deacetylase (PgdA/CDA1 family)
LKPRTYMTTSWDDGHPLDMRVAELLTKYGLAGTFYVPRAAQNKTMTAAQIRELGRAFEIGSHTVHHPVLTKMTEQAAWQEISESKFWLEDSTGSSCLLFCPPTGRYTSVHLDMIRNAGYIGMRTAELSSLALPRMKARLLIMPTTVQAYPHGGAAFVKNAIKRFAFANLWRSVVHGRSKDWPEFALSLLRLALAQGGVFHLWGHSWELQEADQWRRLEDALRFMRQFTTDAAPLTNGQICRLRV